jgi:hypothetical protein
MKGNLSRGTGILPVIFSMSHGRLARGFRCTQFPATFRASFLAFANVVAAAQAQPVAAAIGAHGAPSGEGKGGDAEEERENCGEPEGDDQGARADDPVIFENPKTESAVAAGVAGESQIGSGGSKMLDMPSGFGWMAGLARIPTTTGNHPAISKFRMHLLFRLRGSWKVSKTRPINVPFTNCAANLPFAV